MRQAGRYLAEYRAIRAKASLLEICRTPQLAAGVTLQPVERLGVDAAILFADILLPFAPLGLGLSFAQGEGPAIARPTRAPADVARLPEVDPGDGLGYVLEAVRAGAIGFATSTLEQHNGENGIPMPSRLADEREMLELTGALGEVGKGVFQITKGMTTTIPWLEKISERNGRPVMIAALFVDPNDPRRVFDEFGEISAARARGRELWGHVTCFPLGMEFTLSHPYPLEALLAWRPAIEASDAGQYQRVLPERFPQAFSAKGTRLPSVGQGSVLWRRTRNGQFFLVLRDFFLPLGKKK